MIRMRPRLTSGQSSMATITIKDINVKRYDSWQWRGGDSVTPKYKKLVNPDE